jgi:hypothetical protein
LLIFICVVVQFFKRGVRFQTGEPIDDRPIALWLNRVPTPLWSEAGQPQKIGCPFGHQQQTMDLQMAVASASQPASTGIVLSVARAAAGNMMAAERRSFAID